jgi:hypothetical protein
MSSSIVMHSVQQLAHRARAVRDRQVAASLRKTE